MGDRIPEIHSFLFGTGGSVSSIWPNWNNNGYNNFPRIDEHGSNDNPNYPWEEASISTFCLDIFKNGLCEETENLELYYKDYGLVQLHGAAKEYCQFTCGNCPEKGDNGQCWKEHNAKMVYLHDFGGQQETLNDPFDGSFDFSHLIGLGFGGDVEEPAEPVWESSENSWELEEPQEEEAADASPWAWAEAEEDTNYQW